MALLIVLDFVPSTHKDYGALMGIVGRLAKGLAATQDPATGRWWQVMDKPNDSSNWLETSCTAMHAYFLSNYARPPPRPTTTTASARSCSCTISSRALDHVGRAFRRQPGSQERPTTVE